MSEMPRTLRPLLPAPSETSRHPDEPTATTSKSNHVPAACITCRKQKVKCPGERPECLRCLKRRTPCQYTTQPGETVSQASKRKYHAMRDHSTVHEEILDLLKNLPDQDAQCVLKRIRYGDRIEAILNQVKAGDALLQMAVRPEAKLRYEFPYLPHMPEYYLANNPYLDSIIYESAMLFPTRRTSNSLDCEDPNQRATLNLDDYESLYMKPFHAAEIIDARLFDLKLSSWTNVCDDDDLMQDILQSFFRCEYHFSAAFQKDYFLEDLAAGRTDFCSSLLVNTTLAYACIGHPRLPNRVEYWNPNTLAYRFLAEAKRIWELEFDKPRMTTIQAGIIFSVFHNSCGLDEIGAPYRIHAIKLADHMHLFDSNMALQTARIRNGRAFTAWTLYNWETLTAYSFMTSPLLKKSPQFNLPDPSEDGQWYGEVWVKYPLTQRLLPSHFGEVFKARSQFRIIMNHFCETAYSKDLVISLDEAHEIRLQLKNWYDGLPKPLLPRTIVLPGQLQIHMYYHQLLLNLYRPLLRAKSDTVPSPYDIVTEAEKSLQTLIRLYYLRHGFEAMDLFLVIPLVGTAYDCVDKIHELGSLSSPDLELLRSTLILVTKGLCNQRRNHYLAEALFRVIRGRMRVDEVMLLTKTMNTIELETYDNRPMVQEVRSQWPISVVQEAEQKDSHILSNLVEHYAHMNVEEVE